jgi:hypothetical protein
MKRILFIIVFALVVLGLASLVWYFVFGKKTIDDIPGGQPFVDENVFGEFFDTNNTGNNNFVIDPNDRDADNIDDSIDKIIEIPALRQISREPVAGYTFFTKDKEVEVPNVGTSTPNQASDEDGTGQTEIIAEYVFRFIERATGHIFETTESNLTTQKISNTTIQKINNAYFLSNPNKFLYDSLSVNREGLDTFFNELIISATSTEENTLKTDSYSILASNLQVSDDLEEFAYLNTGFDLTSIFVNSQNLVGEKEILETPLREIILDWPNQNTFTLLTKPSNGEGGYLYRLTRSGNLQKLIGVSPGLTAKLSPDEKYLIFSETSGNNLVTRIQNTEDGEIRRLPTFILPEKCVYTNKDGLICAMSERLQIASYPDDWYKGLVSFDDILVKIDLETGKQTTLYIFNKEVEGIFDIVDPRTTKNDEFLLFKNKNDLTLWALDLDKIDNSEDFSGVGDL